MLFYLGTQDPGWVGRPDIGVPVFVSVLRFEKRRRMPVAACRWALDSGAFSELLRHGRWVRTVDEYAEQVERARGCGMMDWAAPMDWMCEPFMVDKTGLSVEEHQHRTVQNFLDLRDRGPWFVPVLQGWTLPDYERCIGLYRQAGVDLAAEPVVGLGSVCRRQATAEIGEIVRLVAGEGIRAHGFGVKKDGVERYGRLLASSDSLAWSYAARRAWPLPGCRHRTCSACPRYALRWRAELLGRLDQLTLEVGS